MSKTNTVDLETKINVIFDFIQDWKSQQDSVDFWSTLNENEINQLSSIESETTISFDDLKSC